MNLMTSGEENLLDMTLNSDTTPNIRQNIAHTVKRTQQGLKYTDGVKDLLFIAT